MSTHLAESLFQPDRLSANAPNRPSSVQNHIRDFRIDPGLVLSAEAFVTTRWSHNDISNVLSTAPDRFAPMHSRMPDGDVDARPWCQGFHAAMQLRLSAWAPLLDISNINHSLLLPILLHCLDDQGRPMLGPPRAARESEEFLRDAHTDIPAAVEAMRQFWMPIRYARAG